MENGNIVRSDSNKPQIILSGSEKLKRLLKWISLPILVIGGILILILGLNYFNLISLSPNFSFLPKKTPNEATKSTAPLETKISIVCPSVQEFCDQAKEVIKQKRFIGLGANLLEGTPIYAVFDGGIQIRTRSIASKSTNSKSSPEVINQIELISSDQELVAVYYLKGKPPTKYRFKKGEEIAKIPKEQILSYDNYNFVFVLTDRDRQVVSVNDFTFKN